MSISYKFALVIVGIVFWEAASTVETYEVVGGSEVFAVDTLVSLAFVYAVQ